MRRLLLLRGLVGAIAIAVVVAVVALWPSAEESLDLAEGLAAETERAEVLAVTAEACPPPQPGTCVSAEAKLRSGRDEGATVIVALGSPPLAPEAEPGDSIRLSEGAATTGALPAGGPPAYNFADFERRGPLLWLRQSDPRRAPGARAHRAGQSHGSGRRGVRPAADQRG